METVRVEFSNELGDQYVEMRTFKLVPWGLQKQFAAVGDVEKDGNAKMRLAEVIATALLVGGDVKNSWTGEAMTFPLTDATVGDAPGEMFVAVLAKFGEMRSAAVDPK